MTQIRFNPGAERAYSTIPTPLDIPLNSDLSVMLQSNGITVRCPGHNEVALVLRDSHGRIRSLLHLEQEPDQVGEGMDVKDNPRAGHYRLVACVESDLSEQPFPFDTQAPWTTNEGELSPMIEWPRIEPEEVEPVCDICGKPDWTEEGEFNDWNGETGCHISCEEFQRA